MVLIQEVRGPPWAKCLVDPGHIPSRVQQYHIIVYLEYSRLGLNEQTSLGLMTTLLQMPILSDQCT